MRVVQTHACTNRIHDSRTVTHKLCTLEYGKKAPRCAVISLFSPSSKGTDEEAVRGELGMESEVHHRESPNGPAGIIRAFANIVAQHLNKGATHR